MSELSNRRQRQKKLEKDLKEAQAKHTPVPSPKATIPSPSHDITVTVPFIDPRDAGYPIHEGYNFVGHVDSINSQSADMEVMLVLLVLLVLLLFITMAGYSAWIMKRHSKQLDDLKKLAKRQNDDITKIVRFVKDQEKTDTQLHHRVYRGQYSNQPDVYLYPPMPNILYSQADHPPNVSPNVAPPFGHYPLRRQ